MRGGSKNVTVFSIAELLGECLHKSLSFAWS